MLKRSQKSSTATSEPIAANTYRFAEFTADLASRTLARNGQRIFVSAKAFDLLAVLLEHAGDVVDKQMLMDVVWHDANVQDGNLSQNIFTLRKLLGEGARDNRFIVTVPGHGYRFVAEVHAADDPPAREVETAGAQRAAPPASRTTRMWRWPLVTVVVLSVGLSGYLLFARGRAASTKEEATPEAIVIPPSGAGHSANRAAYQAYLKGRYLWNKRTVPELDRSIEYFNEAVRRDPAYALAYAGLADTYVMLARHTDAQAAARRALAIDAKLAGPHATLGNIALFHDWNWDEAGKELRAAIAADTAYPTAHHWYAYQRAATGHVDEAIREMQRALDLDPLSLIIATDLGHMFYLARQYDRALEQYRRVIEMDAGFVMAHWRLGETLQRLRRWDEAAAAFRQSGVDTLGRVAEALLDQPRAAEHLRRLSGHAVVTWKAYDLAQSMAVVRAVNDAFAQLDLSRLQHEPELVLLAADPSFDELRADPRFETIIRQIRLGRD